MRGLGKLHRSSDQVAGNADSWVACVLGARADRCVAAGAGNVYAGDRGVCGRGTFHTKKSQRGKGTRLRLQDKADCMYVAMQRVTGHNVFSKNTSYQTRQPLHGISRLRVALTQVAPSSTSGRVTKARCIGSCIAKQLGHLHINSFHPLYTPRGPGKGMGRRYMGVKQNDHRQRFASVVHGTWI